MKKKIGLSLVFILAPALLLAQAVADCSRIFEAEMRDHVIHGATVMAGGVDGVDVVASWGWADAAHTIPMTPRTVIDMASVTKTAAGVTAYLIAHARGKVDVDVPFTNCLPAYSAALPRTITLRDLANHVSGFGEADGRGKRVYFSDDPRTMLRNILSMPPKDPLPGKVVYSCRNYVLLGQAFEATLGCRAADFCRKEIFLPAGMGDTSLGAPLPSVGPERLAQTCGTKRGGVISDFVARPLWAAGIGTFNAGLFSTAEDMAKLMRVYLRGGVCGRVRRRHAALRRGGDGAHRALRDEQGRGRAHVRMAVRKRKPAAGAVRHVALPLGMERADRPLRPEAPPVCDRHHHAVRRLQAGEARTVRRHRHSHAGGTEK